jgi:hypothetical protein
MIWLLLITTLPTENATVRMRAWRALKTSGAAVLRDGVYLLPRRDSYQDTLNGIAVDVRENGGTAYLLQVNEENEKFQVLFDRTPEFSELLADITKSYANLNNITPQITLKQSRKLRKKFEQLVEIDFFLGEAQKQTAALLQELESAIHRKLSPDEPHAMTGEIPRLSVADYQGRVWATRARPWADRLASAWLIRRFIDKNSHLLWLVSPNDCPTDALSFDFDGATFSHVGAKVTFETLLAGFNLESPSLQRLAGIIHFLDVGGVQPPEAQGIEQVLTGLCETITDDDQLFATASIVFDSLLAAFEKDISL